MSRIDKSPEMLAFIDLIGNMSVAVLKLSDIQVGGAEVDIMTRMIDQEILRGNTQQLENSLKIKKVNKQRAKALYKGLCVLKLYFERGLYLLNKLIEQAKQDVQD